MGRDVTSGGRADQWAVGPASRGRAPAGAVTSRRSARPGGRGGWAGEGGGGQRGRGQPGARSRGGCGAGAARGRRAGEAEAAPRGPLGGRLETPGISGPGERTGSGLARGVAAWGTPERGRWGWERPWRGLP